MELDFVKMPRFQKHSMKIWQLIPQWAHAHQVPEEAVIHQLYIAHAWADSNPKKAPKKDPVRFLWSWMAQAKRYGNLKAPQRPTIKLPEPEPNYDMTVDEMIAIRQANMRRGHV